MATNATVRDAGRRPSMASLSLWQRVPIDQMRIDNPRREAAGWLAFALAYVGASLLTGLVIRAWPNPLFGAVGLTQDATYLLGFKFGLLLLLPSIVLAWQGYRPRDFLPEQRLGWRLGLVCFLAFAAGFSLNLGHVGPIVEAVTAQGTNAIPLLGAAVLIPLLTAGLAEELVFRGVLHTRLERTWGRTVAWLLTAVLFTAWHLPTRYLLASGVEGSAGDLASVLVGTGLPVLVVGLVFGAAWDRWRNLPALIAAHWAIDILPSASSMLGIHF